MCLYYRRRLFLTRIPQYCSFLTGNFPHWQFFGWQFSAWQFYAGQYFQHQYCYVKCVRYNRRRQYTVCGMMCMLYQVIYFFLGLNAQPSAPQPNCVWSSDNSKYYCPLATSTKFNFDGARNFCQFQTGFTLGIYKTEIQRTVLHQIAVAQGYAGK